ncbi:MAG: hypothetical protein ACRDGQ_09670 [Candidatus Limnocylindrales bacterium]
MTSQNATIATALRALADELDQEDTVTEPAFTDNTAAVDTTAVAPSADVTATAPDPAPIDGAPTAAPADPAPADTASPTPTSADSGTGVADVIALLSQAINILNGEG